MTDSIFKKANSYLESDNKAFRPILCKIKTISTLNQQLKPYLGAHLAAHCEVANIRDHTLILIAANASIATEIRLQAYDLLKRIKQDASLNHINHIQCKVKSYCSNSYVTPTHCMQPLSETTADVLAMAAESLKDPNLKQIMLRIAKNSGK